MTAISGNSKNCRLASAQHSADVIGPGKRTQPKAVESVISFGLQNAGEVAKMPDGMFVPSSREVLTEQARPLQRWDNERLPLEYSDRYAIRDTLESNPAESRRMSKNFNFDAMSIDEMWQLHEEINAVLSIRLTSEKRELEKRLAQLRREREMRQSEAADSQAKDAPRERRKYPRVFAKYQNPNEPSETWSGRGKQPRWLIAALKMGHTIDEFVIRNVESNKNNFRRQRA